MRWLLGLFAACGDNAARPAVDAGIDGAAPYVICERASAPASVVGGGPQGSLHDANVFVHLLTGFCPDILVITVTPDDALLVPAHPASAVIRVMIPSGATTPWSGTFPVMIESPDESSESTGTLEIEHGTPAGITPSRLRGTARFTGTWNLTVGFDTPYCAETVCI